MAYLPQYLIDLNLIIADTEAGKITGSNEALDKFKIFVTQIKNIGRYSVANWPSSFMSRIYEFGKSFSIIDPTEFLTAIEDEILISSFAEREILHVIKSEILWNFENHLKQESTLIELLQQYVANAELMHTLGHIKNEKKNYIEAIELYTQAHRINPSDTFLSAKFKIDLDYVEYLIENEKYEAAESLIEDRISDEIYNGNFIRQNWFVFLKNRIKDYKLLNRKALKKEAELKKMLDAEFQAERRKVIELLGLFTAIIAFIFTTVSIAKSFDFSQAINFITCLGLVLIAFAVTISLVFHQKTIVFYKDTRLYVLLVIIVFLYIFLSSTTLVVNCFDRLSLH